MEYACWLTAVNAMFYWFVQTAALIFAHNLEEKQKK